MYQFVNNLDTLNQPDKSMYQHLCISNKNKKYLIILIEEQYVTLCLLYT